MCKSCKANQWIISNFSKKRVMIVIQLTYLYPYPLIFFLKFKGVNFMPWEKLQKDKGNKQKYPRAVLS